MPDMPVLPSPKKDTRKERLIEAFASGATWFEATRSAGVSERTVRRWCEADPEFAELVAEARCQADDQVEYQTYKNCLDPDPANNTLRIFWLKSRRPEVYRDTAQPETAGPGVIVIHAPSPAPLPDPQA